MTNLVINTNMRTYHMELRSTERTYICLLYTSDAADERSSVDLGGRRIIKKKKTEQWGVWCNRTTTLTKWQAHHKQKYKKTKKKK